MLLRKANEILSWTNAFILSSKISIFAKMLTIKQHSIIELHLLYSHHCISERALILIIVST